jgi:hypothetical protein
MLTQCYSALSWPCSQRVRVRVRAKSALYAADVFASVPSEDQRAGPRPTVACGDRCRTAAVARSGEIPRYDVGHFLIAGTAGSVAQWCRDG